MGSTVLKWAMVRRTGAFVELVDLIFFFRAVGNYTAKPHFVVFALALIACRIPVHAKIDRNPFAVTIRQ